MKRAEKENFFGRLYSAQEVILELNNKKYCVQGYYKNDMAYMYLEQWEPEIDNPILWEYIGKDMVECGDNFLDAQIFENKSFWEVEKDIQWVDD